MKKKIIIAVFVFILFAVSIYIKYKKIYDNYNYEVVVGKMFIDNRRISGTMDISVDLKDNISLNVKNVSARIIYRNSTVAVTDMFTMNFKNGIARSVVDFSVPVSDGTIAFVKDFTIDDIVSFDILTTMTIYGLPLRFKIRDYKLNAREYVS